MISDQIISEGLPAAASESVAEQLLHIIRGAVNCDCHSGPITGVAVSIVLMHD